MGKIIIDCDATPFVPEGWSIRPEDQIPGAVDGQLVYGPLKISLYIDKAQKCVKRIPAYNLVDKLVGKPLLKANVLDYLLACTSLVPGAWMVDDYGIGRWIVFWALFIAIRVATAVFVCFGGATAGGAGAALPSATDSATCARPRSSWVERSGEARHAPTFPAFRSASRGSVRRIFSFRPHLVQLDFTC